VAAGKKSPYAGRWIARLGERIVGQGGTPEQALWAAKASRFKEEPQIEYIPTMQPLSLPENLGAIRAIFPPEVPAYLVGGAVRDALLGRTTHDLDFVVTREALKWGRRVADALQGAYYPLDEERQIARVVLTLADGERQFLDFSILRGPDLESDLRGRDFTINAMALEVHRPQAMLDPIGGAADLLAKQLRACYPGAFREDPIRILRGVRLAAELGMLIERESLKEMRLATGLLPEVSVERKRDELVRILDGPNPAAALRALDMIGALDAILPEVRGLKGVDQSAPHKADVWNHSLDTVRELQAVLGVLSPAEPAGNVTSFFLGLISVRLGRYRGHFVDHLGTRLNPDRTLRSLLFFAALYHDIAKPVTRLVDERGQARFFDHDLLGADILAERAAALHLSNDEAARLKTIVRHHMRPLLLGNNPDPVTPRAIYRFFRDTGPAGVDICLLSLADVLATHAGSLTHNIWEHHLGIVRTLLEAWWEHPQERVSPLPWINGHELMAELGLQPGERIGQLLEAIREGQVIGSVTDRESALELARGILIGPELDQG